MPRNRREPTPGAGFNAIRPDPSQVGGVAEAPFVRLPDPASLFARRAARLRALAPEHTLAPYLLFLAGIVDAQAAIADGPAEPIAASQLALAAEHAMPPLGGQRLAESAGFDATLTALLDQLDLAAAPPASQAAAAAVRSMPRDERGALATDVMEGAFPTDRIAEILFVAAGLQVHLARQAARLEAGTLQPAADGVCPGCGGAPVGSLVVGWTAASKARYCACALCATQWNYVRIKCTACGSTDGISYYTLEDGPKTVGVEACTACHSYIKHLQQHEDEALEPVADDVASYALDLLAREEGFRRASLNPLFLTG